MALRAATLRHEVPIKTYSVKLRVNSVKLCVRLIALPPPATAIGFTHCKHLAAVHAPNRLSRLRGSMYSFIDTANRNSPMNVITTSTTGNAIHHQMPATSAVCWLAQ